MLKDPAKSNPLALMPKVTFDPKEVGFTLNDELDDDRCEVCGLTIECDHCLLDAASAYGKITPEQEARERAKLPPRVIIGGP